MINYILHVSVLLGLGFILYQLLLKKETFYALNRVILFSYLVLAFVLPSIQIPSNWSLRSEVTSITSSKKTESNKNIVANHTIHRNAIDTDSDGSFYSNNKSSLNPTESSNNIETRKISIGSPSENITITDRSKSILKSIKWSAAIKWIYIVGLAIFLVNFLVQFGILMFYRVKYPTLRDDKMIIVEMEGDKAPFSFLNMIYINPTKYDYDTYEQILAHEKIHITKWHSADIFLSELALIFQWFNPFAWYYRKAVEHNLEYLTDQEMLASGANAEVYQMNLLKVSVPELPLALSTNYNQSFLKKRIQMMNTKKSSAQSTWKYLFILPILGLTVSLMNPTFSVAQNTPNAEPLTTQTNTLDPVIPTLNHHEPNPVEPTGQSMLKNNQLDDLINPMDAISNAKVPMQKLSDYGITSNETLSVSVNDGNTSIISSSQKSFTLSSSSGRTIVKNANDDIETKGIWEAEIKGSEVCLFIKKGGISKNYFWSSTKCIKTSEFSPQIKKGAEGEFTLIRDAGTMTLKGEFEDNEGTGRYQFVTDNSYTNYIKDLGFDIDEKKIIHFFLSDIDKDYFKFLQAEGYTNIDDDELISMAIHGVDKEFIKDINGEFKKVNYKKPSAEELVSMKIHNVDLEYIKSFGKELYEDLDVDQIVSAAIHNVDPSYISEFRKLGYDDLSFDDLISAAIHDVDVAYVKELKKTGLEDLTFDNIISANIHNVDPEYILKFKNSGFKNLNFDQMISASIHNVDPDYIKAFKNAGFTDITFDDLISASIHNVDIDYIQSFKNAGLEDVDFEDLISASIHGIDIDYISKAKTYGFELTFDQLISAGIHNVDLEYIEAFSDAGIEDLTFDDMITASIHRIDPKMIKEFQSMGFDDLTFEELTTAAIHDISPQFIKRVKDSGYNDISFDDIVSFKIHNIDPDDINGLKDLGFDLNGDDIITAGIHNITPRFIKTMVDKGYKDLSFSEYVKLKIHGF